MGYRQKIIRFLQNRVWRTYPGGKVLDQLAGKDDPKDNHFPEDWIGSITRANNPGRESIEEGVSRVLIAGKETAFDELLTRDPEYFLGKAHVEAFGPRPQLLVKLLDSAIRLHFQCHPTAEFARMRMNEPSGKAEAYHILAIRKDISEPYVYIGFQRPPKLDEFKKWIQEQDLESIEACLDRIPVKPGDSLFIPGGFPHAIGEGILMVEIMEPSDLAIRFEFEKAGYILPESARFMGRGLDFCLEAFDFSQTSLADIQDRYFFPPKLIETYPNGNGHRYHILGHETTPAMRVAKIELTGPVELSDGAPFIGIVTAGELKMESAEDQQVLKTFDKFFFPAMGGPVKVTPLQDKASVLQCQPPDPAQC